MEILATGRGRVVVKVRWRRRGMRRGRGKGGMVGFWGAVFLLGEDGKCVWRLYELFTIESSARYGQDGIMEENVSRKGESGDSCCLD